MQHGQHVICKCVCSCACDRDNILLAVWQSSKFCTHTFCSSTQYWEHSTTEGNDLQLHAVPLWHSANEAARNWEMLATAMGIRLIGAGDIGRQFALHLDSRSLHRHRILARAHGDRHLVSVAALTCGTVWVCAGCTRRRWLQRHIRPSGSC